MWLLGGGVQGLPPDSAGGGGGGSARAGLLSDRAGLVAPARRRNVRKGVQLFVKNTFDLTLIGRFKLLHVVLWMMAMACLSERRGGLYHPACPPARPPARPPTRPPACRRIGARAQHGRRHCLPMRAGAWNQVNQTRQTQANQPFATPNAEIAFLSKRWRAERNLWIAAFTLSMWG